MTLLKISSGFVEAISVLKKKNEVITRPVEITNKMKIEFLDMIFEVCLVDLKADFFLAKFLFFGFRLLVFFYMLSICGFFFDKYNQIL